MKFQFKIQGYQTEAVEDTVNVFRGQPKLAPKHYRRDVGKRGQQQETGTGKTYVYIKTMFELNETTIEEMAKLLPTHLVIRDASAANDNVLDNFDQIIESYSNEHKITTHVL